MKTSGTGLLFGTPIVVTVAATVGVENEDETGMAVVVSSTTNSLGFGDERSTLIFFADLIIAMFSEGCFAGKIQP